MSTISTESLPSGEKGSAPNALMINLGLPIGLLHPRAIQEKSY